MISNNDSFSLESYSPINHSSYKELLQLLERAIEDMGISDRINERLELIEFSKKVQNILSEGIEGDKFEFPFLYDINNHRHFHTIDVKILSNEFESTFLAKKIRQSIEKYFNILVDISQFRYDNNVSLVCALKPFIESDGLNYTPKIRIYQSSANDSNSEELFNELKKVFKSTKVTLDFDISSVEKIQAETELWNIFNRSHIVNLENIVFHQQNRQRCQNTKNESLITLAQLYNKFDFKYYWKSQDCDLPF